jgi:urease accessory protein
MEKHFSSTNVAAAGNDCRETLPYRQTPKAMPAGAVGKHGYLRLDFERTADGRDLLRSIDRRVPIIVQRALRFDEEWPELPCVYILSSGGPYVDGDRYEQHFRMRKGASAFISTGAATKVAEMRYNHAALHQTITLEEDSYLEVLPEPLIPCRHSRFLSRTKLTVAPSATLCFAEIFSGGRKHAQLPEHFAYDLLSVSTTGRRPDGTLLFADKLLVEPARHSPQQLGLLGTYEVFAHVIVLTPPESAEQLYALTRAGIDIPHGIATAVSRLPHRSGLMFKVLGRENEPVKRRVRAFCSDVRWVVKGRRMPEEFPWR